MLIETPPHSTGLAFDIDYRHDERGGAVVCDGRTRAFEEEGRIEVIRERNANYHVFAFLNGTRPSDDLITASLEEARAAAAGTSRTGEKSRCEKQQVTKRTSKSRRARATPWQNRRRR